MKRSAILGLIALAGLPTGWFGAKALTPDRDRVNEGISLFVEQCLPLVRHDRRVPGPGLAPIKLWPQEET